MFSTTIPLETGPTLATDIEAPMHVFYVGTRANWGLLASQKTLDELLRTKNGTLREDLIEYALGFVNRDLDDEDRRFAADFERRIIDAPFVAALPELPDRELIGNAIGFAVMPFAPATGRLSCANVVSCGRVPLRILTLLSGGHR